MQHIQDKEFDQLFRDRFEDAEIDPSADLWARIKPQLETKRKRTLPVYWMAAAAGIAALTAGLLFFNHPAETRHQQPAIARAHSVITGQQITDSNSLPIDLTGHDIKPSEPVLAEISNQVKPTFQEPVKSLKHTTKPVLQNLNAAQDELAEHTADLYSKKVLMAMQPLKEITHLDSETLVIKQKRMGLPASPVKAHEVLVMANLNQDKEDHDEVTNENTQAEHTRIRNVGDLVNLVVNKLDKSDKKFLQFKTEDDNSSLIAINIGIIKFNKKKHK